MKKVTATYLPAFITLLLVINLSSCLKDKCTKTYSYKIYEPVYKTTAEVRANIKSNAPREVEHPGKLFIVGNYIFLNEVDRGIHVINNSNPASPQRVAFIDIPGNIDLAVKGNILYADFYTDMVALDISDPLNAVVKKFTEGVFPERSYINGFVANQNSIITEWNIHDTTISESCEGQGFFGRPGVLFLASADASQKSSAYSAVGVGGSMARFAVVSNYLYTVGYSDLSSFNISNSSSPVFTNKTMVDWHVETIYPFKDKLFIGSNNGMYIYDVQSSPGNPVKLGQFVHARSCDPVIADGDFAYITLSDGNACLESQNQLEVVDIKNLANPFLVKQYQMTHPLGLSKDGNLLFVCDGTDGLKIYNASDPGSTITLKKQITMSETYDVIAFNKIAMVVAKDGLYQYDYSNPENIKLLSKIGLKL